MALDDLLPAKAKVIICGTAVTKTSKAANAYYANGGNNLYETLHEVGITPWQITPNQYRELADFGVGFTDLVKGRTGLDNELQKNDFDIEAFKSKILQCKPKVVCFNGKLAASYFKLGRRNTKKIYYGLMKDFTIGDTKIFVAPSSGAQGRRYWDIKHWHDLKKLIDAV